ncbi:hypothetical protein [Seonamhaeicola marinus]|uniref:Uncharacterized protein n=1 Tax=Seonamhaeicola marinus TaxID=1912246 RepID=A0A5D0HF80_9FLAO|nr:hypothetical protein [Seonamhaeicola marinus]TYA70013.1 hypothetical protein FUA24_22250 [Seonamhaeicola marinus]
MHKSAALFFVALYVVAMLRPIQPCIEYMLNQDYIAEFLCINKNEPELQCKGKCHLAKQIEKQQEEPQHALSVSMENYPIGFVSILNLKKPTNFIVFNSPLYSYRSLYNFQFSGQSFQPPELV